MTRRPQLGNRSATLLIIVFISVCFIPQPVLAATDNLDDLLGRTSQQVSKFLEQFSDVKCTEKVTQEKLGKEERHRRGGIAYQ